MDNKMGIATDETIVQILQHQKELCKSFRNMFVGILILCIVMVLSFATILRNYEIGITTTTTTEQNVEGDGSNIINGDQFNDNSSKNH